MSNIIIMIIIHVIYFLFSSVEGGGGTLQWHYECTLLSPHGENSWIKKLLSFENEKYAKVYIKEKYAKVEN